MNAKTALTVSQEEVVLTNEQLTCQVKELTKMIDAILNHLDHELIVSARPWGHEFDLVKQPFPSGGWQYIPDNPPHGSETITHPTTNPSDHLNG